MKSAKPSPVVGVPLLLGDIYNFILGRVPGYEIVMTSHCFKKKSVKNGSRTRSSEPDLNNLVVDQQHWFISGFFFINKKSLFKN